MKYLALIRIQFKDNFAYRISTIAGIIVGIFQVYILYYIWCVVFKGSDSVQGYSLDQMTTYIIFSTIMYRMIELGITLRVSDLVKSGDIALKLTKPMDFVRSLVCESIGILSVNFFTTVIPIAVFFVFTIGGYYQNDILAVLLFVISFIMALFISIYIDVIFGLLTFWTESGWGLRVIRQAMIKLLSGALLPLAIMPNWLHSVSNVLPFKTLIDIPLKIYLFGISEKAFQNIFYQLIWVIALIIISKGLYHFIVQKIDINGG